MALLAPAALLMGSAVGGRGLEADAPATGDYAVLELYTRLAAQGQQLLGPYSRFGFHHPGPAYFYASLPLYLLTGERITGLLLTAALVNAVSIALMLWRAGRDGGRPALLAAALVIALFLSWRGPSWVFSAWNPNVAVMPFGVALVWFASVAAGRWRALPVAAVAASFAAQTHVGSVPALLAIALASGALLARGVREVAGLPPAPPVSRGPVVLAALLAAALWAPPLVEQFRPDGGNLGHILAFSMRPDEPHRLGAVLGAAGTAMVGWMVGARDSAAASLLLVVVVALAAAHAGARRRVQAFPAALSLVTLAAVAAAVLSAARVTGPLLPYLLRWMAMLAVGTAAAVASALAPVRRPRLETARTSRMGTTVALVALALVCGRNLALARSALQAPAHAARGSESAARLAEAVAPPLAEASRRALVEVGPDADRDLVLGVLLALDKGGARMAVSPFGPFRLRGRWAPDGTEDARLLLMGEDAALASKPGVRQLGREAGLFAYLVR